MHIICRYGMNDQGCARTACRIRLRFTRRTARVSSALTTLTGSRQRVRASEGRRQRAITSTAPRTTQGRPYQFVDADILLQDFFREVRRVLRERGIPETVIAVEEERK